MTQKELVDRVRVIIGDAEKTIIPDDARIRALSNFAYQKLYKRLGITFRDILREELPAGENRILLPDEFFRASLVLVNGIEYNEISEEDAIKGTWAGLNVSGDFNAVSQTVGYPYGAYYFTNTQQGRFLCIVPVPSYPVEVFCMFKLVPQVAKSASPFAELVPSMYADALIYATVLEVLPLMSSREASELLAKRNIEMITDGVRLSPELLANVKIMMPIQVQIALKNEQRLLQEEYERKFNEEVKRMKKEMQLSVNMPPKRFKQGLLDYATRAGSRY